jgi:replication factor A1
VCTQSKTSFHEFKNHQGHRNTLIFHFVEIEREEIHITCFIDSTNILYAQIQYGNVYIVSKAIFKLENKKFNHLNNDWELFLQTTSLLHHCPTDNPSIPQYHFNFNPISEINLVIIISIVGIINYVTNTSPSSLLHMIC